MRINPDIPSNGIALFSFDGDVYQLDPPQTITSFQYVCGSEFWLDPLRKMTESHDIIGLLVMDNREATIGILRGAIIEILDNLQSGIAGKHHKGGQSQNQFMRLHEEMTQLFHKSVAEAANNIWSNYPTLQGILIGGSGMSKDNFIASGLLDYRLRTKMLAIFDTGYTDYQGMKELLLKSASLIQGTEYVRQKQHFDQFMESIGKDDGKVVYGKKEVQDALRFGKIDTLLLSDDIGEIIQQE